jgi:hypothetical protein
VHGSPGEATAAWQMTSWLVLLAVSPEHKAGRDARRDLRFCLCCSDKAAEGAVRAGSRRLAEISVGGARRHRRPSTPISAPPDEAPRRACKQRTTFPPKVLDSF